MVKNKCVRVWIVRVTIESKPAKWYKFKPTHEDVILGVYDSEKEAQHAIETHAKWLDKPAGAKNMQNYWVTVERRSDGYIRTVSVHSTHVYKGKRDYANTAYHYTIVENCLWLNKEP